MHHHDTGGVVPEGQATWIRKFKNAPCTAMDSLHSGLFFMYYLLSTKPKIHLFPVLSMKKFLLRIFIFIFIFFVFILVLQLFQLHTKRYKTNIRGFEIYNAIHKSKQTNQSATIILLGDSVAYQLFDNRTNNQPIYSLACNRAIGMVGHFILLNNYLNAGNQVDTVYLLFTPYSFINNLDEVMTYHYFLKPFYLEEYFPLFTGTVMNQIHKIPYYQLSRFPLILTSHWAPDFTPKDKINYTFLSPISVEYLVKIKELSIKHGFKVIVVSPPVSLSRKRDIEKMNKNEIVINNFDNEFSNYFQNIIYLDDGNFIDGVHLKNPRKYKEYYENTFTKVRVSTP